MTAKKSETHAEAEPCKACGTCPTCGNRPGQTITIRTYPTPYYPWATNPYWYGGTYTAPTITCGSSTTSGYTNSSSVSIAAVNC